MQYDYFYPTSRWSLQPRFGLGCHRQGTDPAPLSEVFVRFGYCARLAEQAGSWRDSRLDRNSPRRV